MRMLFNRSFWSLHSIWPSTPTKSLSSVLHSNFAKKPEVTVVVSVVDAVVVGDDVAVVVKEDVAVVVNVV